MKFALPLLALLGLAASSLHAAPPVTKILILTDSHGVGPFGEEILERLRHAPGVTVDLRAIGGSAPHWFERGTYTKGGYQGQANNTTPAPKHSSKPMHTPLLKDLLVDMKDQLVVSELGANLIGSKKYKVSREFVESTTRRMVTAIQHSGAKCLWIGPPVMRYFGDAEIARIIEWIEPALTGDSRFPRCEWIDSRPFSSYPATGGDGIHYSFKGGAAIARAWAQAIAREVMSRL